jgi:signal peptidase I
VWASFESDQPFGSISSGNIINHSMLPNAKQGETIFVAKLEHIFWAPQDGGPAHHKIMVYTSRSYGDPGGLRK